jgi:hypothetical protein
LEKSFLVAETSKKALIAKELSRAEQKLVGSRSGKLLMKKLQIEMYSRDPDVCYYFLEL